MKQVWNWLCKPAMLALVGVILLSLLVWFEAPLLSFDGHALFGSAAVRWWCIALLWLAWAGWFLGRMVLAHMANVRLAAGVARSAQVEQPGARESQEEIATLARRMEEAMAILRASGRKGGGQALYQLPWYMFVGAPGAGKTTALVQSGLHFPLAEKMGKGALGGVGGTRNCDWWFTDEAVLLDTAGRYTTQDSHGAVDQAAWHGFLQLLRRHRKHSPINGVIVAVSVADLLQQGEAGVLHHAQTVRARLQELREQLGISFPVYVMVTKCDLLAGFTDFFSELGKEERAQVWGVTFPANDAGRTGAALAAFPAEFRQLAARLESQALGRIEAERDLRRRAAVHGFPQEFYALGGVLQVFLEQAFQDSRFADAPLLRGVYFTSGTQEGHPIDRVLGALADAYGVARQALPANAASGRSYFLTRLMRDVIFAEAGLAAFNPAHERRRRAIELGGLAALALLCVGGLVALAASYAGNGRLVASVDAGLAEVRATGAAVAKDAASPLAALPLLAQARGLPTGYAQQGEAVPWRLRLGLYQGEQLGAGTQALYQHTLQALLLPDILRRMEAQLRRGGAAGEENLYGTLRAYLMLGGDAPPDAQALVAWSMADWRGSLPEATPAQREALAAHVAALAEGLHGAPQRIPLDRQLVADVRAVLARMPLAQRVFQGLRSEMANMNLPEFSVASVAGADAGIVLSRRSGEPLTRGIPGMFTQAGYVKFLELLNGAAQRAASENWVLDRREAESAGNVVQLQARLLELYFDAYAGEWERYLADVRLAPFSGAEQGARIMGLAAGAESPLRKLLQAAARETTFGLPGQGDRQSALGAMVSKVTAAVTSKTGVAAPVPGESVNLRFAGLHRMVGTGAAGAPLDQLLASLKGAADYLVMAERARRAGAAAPSGNPLPGLLREAEGGSPLLAQMLREVDSDATALASGGERERISGLWAAEAGPFCRRAIAGRYPLARAARQEVTRDDFTRFFGPNGMMDKFFAEHLHNYVEVRDGPWRWRPGLDNVALGMPQQVLDMFQRAAQVRDAYFPVGSAEPSLRFELKLLSADPAWNGAQLEIDNQAVPFGPPATVRPASIVVPNGRGSSGVVKLDVPPPGTQALRTEGPWAWLRMVDQGVLEAQGRGERYKLSFDSGGQKLVYAMTAGSVQNPFQRAVLEQFRCLDRL